MSASRRRKPIPAPAPILPGSLAGVSAGEFGNAGKDTAKNVKKGIVPVGSQAEAVLASGSLSARSYEPREAAPVTDPFTITDIYADGGVIHENPAPLGGVFAFCFVNVYGERIADHLQRLAESKYPEYLESHTRRMAALNARLAEMHTEANAEAAAPPPDSPEQANARRESAQRIAEEISQIAAELEADSAPMSIERFRLTLTPTKLGKRKDGSFGEVPQVYEGWGHLPPRPELPKGIGNNYSELAAVVAALANLPVGWRGRLWTDSEVTIKRCKGVYSPDMEYRQKVREAILKTCTKTALDALLCHLGRIGTQNIDFRLVKGHPNAADLERGHNAAGQVVSKFNVWCDEKCKEVKRRHAGN